ncbi:MAG: hypothetical protein WCF54_16620 [Terracidiphilus sp.]
MSNSVRPIVCVVLLGLLALPFSLHGQKTKQRHGLSYALFKGQPDPYSDQLESLNRDAHWNDDSGNLNPSGLRLRFSKIDEQPAQRGDSADLYRVYVDGAPENKVFTFTTWLMSDTSAQAPKNVYVNGQGLLMIHKPTPEQEMSLSAPGDELVVITTTANAEPIRFLLSRKDKQLEVSATLVPHPVKSEEHGCHLEVRIAEADASSVLILADGFPAKEKIPLVLESENLSYSGDMTTDENGHAVMAAFPYVPGKKQGTFRASAEGPDCLPTVVLPWGPASPVAAPAQKKP